MKIETLIYFIVFMMGWYANKIYHQEYLYGITFLLIYTFLLFINLKTLKNREK